MRLQKLASAIIIFLLILTPFKSFAADNGDFVDDSIRDMSIVLGTTIGGAVLGLSTLSFADEPSKHWRNVAVGGAIGLIVGVGVVVVSQATTHSTITKTNTDLNEYNFDSYARQDFASQRVVESKNIPDIGYTFSF